MDHAHRGAAALIGVDWGTTSARAYRLDSSGRVLDRRSAPLGIQHVQDGRFADALDRLIGEWRDDPAPRIAAGMIGSRQGWIEAPYVSCPADLRMLAQRLTHVPDARLSIVPGITTRDDWGIPDVMRGEETQLLGAIPPDAHRALAVLPGTHSKWAQLSEGSVLDFRTYMSGELFAVLLGHSILGRLADRVDPPSSAIGAAFRRGVSRGLAPGALAHDIFGARTLALHGDLAGAEVAEWLSGLLIGREINQARSWARTCGLDAEPVHIVGSADLCGRYGAALEQCGWTVAETRSDAAAMGLWRIATAARMVEAKSS